MLRTRTLIPPLIARTAAGATVRAWDYKQKRNLVVVFLHAGCARCEEYAVRLAARAAEFVEHEAAVLLVFPEAPPAGLAERLPAVAGLPAPLVVASDMSGRAQRAYLGEDTFTATGKLAGCPEAAGLGAFVADRYGELYARWVVANEDELPGPDNILSWLGQIQVACEECGVSHWPGEP